MDNERAEHTGRAVAQQTPGGPPLAYDGKQLADALGVSLRHLRSLDASGRIPASFRLGRSKRWAAEEIRGWLLAVSPKRQEWIEIKARSV